MSQSKSDSLFTTEFVVLNAIIFLAFCNVAVFFQFHEYLGTLPIDPRWNGFLLAIFSVTVLLIRPVISPFLSPENAKRWIAVSCVCVIVSLMLYHVAQSFWSMTLVRIVHGAGYVVFATAALAKIVGCIPKAKSGQAFGIIGVITLLPSAVVPPALDPLIRWAGGFSQVLALSALLMVPTLPLLALMNGGTAENGGVSEHPAGFRELMRNLKETRIVVLLILSLLVWTSFTPVFYFLKEYGDSIGVPNPGWFFTLSTCAEIGVRLAAGSLFDRLDKARMMAVPLGLLTIGYVVLAQVSGPILFYGMGLFLGLGWGVAMPLLSGLMFDISGPRFRAMNTNLSMAMFQAGYFFGPLLGAPVLRQWGYGALYYSCAGLVLLGLVLSPMLKREQGSMVEAAQ
jgi:predicted MFS family arabinose efflux permease